MKIPLARSETGHSMEESGQSASSAFYYSGQRGCELWLFQQRKVGNMDCTFCLDCVHACPYDNVGLIARTPTSELWTDPYRSGLGRFSRRADLAALVVVLTFGAFLNAFNMIKPVYALQALLARSLNTTSPAPGLALAFVLGLAVLPAALLERGGAGQPCLGPDRGTPAREQRYALCLRAGAAGLRHVAGALQLPFSHRRHDDRARDPVVPGRCGAVRRQGAMGTGRADAGGAGSSPSRPCCSTWARSARSSLPSRSRGIGRPRTNRRRAGRSSAPRCRGCCWCCSCWASGSGSCSNRWRCGGQCRWSAERGDDDKVNFRKSGAVHEYTTNAQMRREVIRIFVVTFVDGTGDYFQSRVAPGRSAPRLPAPGAPRPGREPGPGRRHPCHRGR